MTTKNDVALIKLSTKVDLTTYTPACLANTGDSFVGKTAWVYGMIDLCNYEAFVKLKVLTRLGTVKFPS